MVVIHQTPTITEAGTFIASCDMIVTIDRIRVNDHVFMFEGRPGSTLYYDGPWNVDSYSLVAPGSYKIVGRFLPLGRTNQQNVSLHVHRDDLIHIRRYA